MCYGFFCHPGPVEDEETDSESDEETDAEGDEEN